MEFTGPVQKLLMAIVLSAIKKGAHTIRMTKDPLIVFFDVGRTSIEEIRPPDQLRERLVEELRKLGELQPEDRSGFFVLELADGTSYRLMIELGDGFAVFEIKVAAIDVQN